LSNLGYNRVVNRRSPSTPLRYILAATAVAVNTERQTVGQLITAKDIVDVTARDLTGDGKAEILGSNT